MIVTKMKDLGSRLHWMKYTILRRLVTHRNLNGGKKNLSHIEIVAGELEGKTYSDLCVIHKREIGY